MFSFDPIPTLLELWDRLRSLRADIKNAEIILKNCYEASNRMSPFCAQRPKSNRIRLMDISSHDFNAKPRMP